MMIRSSIFCSNGSLQYACSLSDFQ